jgi:hypothetical protein
MDLVFTRIELVEKLVALIPPPKVHQIHFHGVVAARSGWRRQVVPPKRPDKPTVRLLVRAPSPSRSRWMPWGELLRRVFEKDGFACPKCGEPMELRTVLVGETAGTVLRGLFLTASGARGPPEAAMTG